MFGINLRKVLLRTERRITKGLEKKIESNYFIDGKEVSVAEYMHQYLRKAMFIFTAKTTDPDSSSLSISPLSYICNYSEKNVKYLVYG